MVILYDTTKITQVINKGTGTFQADLKKPNWAGEDFHDHESQKVLLAGNIMTSIAKGTNSVQLGNINRKRPKSPEGVTISIRKGTALTKL